MSLSTQINAFATRVGEEIKAIRGEVADVDVGVKTINGTAPDEQGNITVDAVSDAAEVTYGQYGYDNVADALDSLLYKAIAFTGMSCSVGTQEIGSTVTAAKLTWSFNKTPKTLKFEGEEIDPSTTSKELTGLTVTANKSWTVVATDEKNASATRSAGVSFAHKRYWGVSAESDAANIDSAFVLGLSGKELSSSRGKTFTVNAGDGEYIYYVFPASWGTPTFKVGGFEGGFALVKTFDFTNASGNTTSFVVWRSDNPSLGNTTVAVS